MAFFMEPQRRPEPVFNAPAVVLWLCGAMIGMHALQALAPAAVVEVIAGLFVLQPGVFATGPAGVAAGAVQMIGHMFLHVSLFHLMANTLWLLVFGALIARRAGGALFLAFFLVCGIGAALVYLAADAGYAQAGLTHGLGVVGASGAISGLMGGAIRFAFQRPRWYMDTPPLARLSDRIVVLWSVVWIGLNAALGVGGLFDPAFAGIAWEAHVGGFVVGLVLYPLFDRVRPALPPT